MDTRGQRSGGDVEDVEDVEPVAVERRLGVDPVEGQRVLVVDVDHAQVGQHAQGRDAGAALQVGAGVAEQRRVAPQPVDHEPPDRRAAGRRAAAATVP